MEFKMFKYKVTLLSAIMFFIFMTNSQAVIFGGSNFDFSGYPKHKCSKPYKPYQFTDKYEVDRYNNELQHYINCIEEYVMNSNNDLKRVQEAAREAISEANSLN